jgi:hypothetical protein
MPWQRIECTIEDPDVDVYATNMLERRGYKRVDRNPRLLYYTSRYDDKTLTAHYVWYEWFQCGGYGQSLTPGKDYRAVHDKRLKEYRICTPDRGAGADVSST